MTRTLAPSFAASLAGSAPFSLLARFRLAGFGDDLLHWWEVPNASSPLITLNGGNVSQLNDRVGSVHLVQATAGNQPAYNASGGPRDVPYITLQDTGRVLAGALSVASGHRIGLYVVQRHTAETAARYPFFVDGCLSTPADTTFIQFTRFVAGSQSLAITTPAKTTDWHLRANRPLASGALSQINGATTDPNYTGSGLVREINSVSVGVTGFSGGDFVFAALVVDPTAAKNQLVNTYVAQRTGLTIA